MTLKQQQQQATSSPVAASRKLKYVTPVALLITGFLLGAGVLKSTSSLLEKKQPVPTTIAFLAHDGASTRTWTGVSLEEGESVAAIIGRIASAENIELSWSGSGRDRQIVSFMGKEKGERSWNAYINNASLPTPIGKFYPRPGDTITMIYSLK